MFNRLAYSLIATIGFLCSAPLHGQTALHCGDMQYAHHNPIDYSPLHVRKIRGIVKDIQGFEMPGACVGIFAESSEKLLAFQQTSAGGQFEIDTDLPNGRYRLVVSAPGFCAANVKIVLKKKSRPKQLGAKMRPRGIDVCSSIELK
jgi:hypothetical protein